MAVRVCGARAERDTSGARRCWCGGLFCGPGGFNRSKEFRRMFHVVANGLTRWDFDQVVTQADLYSGDAGADVWRNRLIAHRAQHDGKHRRTTAATS